LEEVSVVRSLVSCVESGSPFDAKGFSRASIVRAVGLVGNEELCGSVVSTHFGEINESNCVEAFLVSRSNSSASQVASRFSSVQSSLLGLRSEELKEIIGNSGLRLSSEDELLEFCLRHYATSFDLQIFEFVLFSRLSDDSASAFVKQVCATVPFEALSPLSDQIFSRFCLPIDRTSAAFKASPSHRAEQNESPTPSSSARLTPFDSLVDYFASKSLPLTASASSWGCGGPNDQNNDRYHPRNALLKGSEKQFWSNAVANSWWSIDFGRNVTVDAYILNGAPGSSYSVSSWDVHVSSDNANWGSVDSRRSIDTKQPTPLFTLSNPAECCFLRITQVGKSLNNDDWFSLGEIDFKGKIRN
jgi:hypothetical protein